MTTPPTINISEEFTDSITVHMNVGQEVIVTTVDKMHLCLIRHHDTMLARHGWLSPMALLVSIVATLVAADFHAFIFSASTWRSMFVVGLLGCAAWLARDLYRAWAHRASDPIATVIAAIKAESAKA